MIETAGEEDRRKIYKLTEDGHWLLDEELKRIDELYRNGHCILEGGRNDQGV